MPIYEFRCNACHRGSSLFVKSVSATLNPACPHCGSVNLVRAISSFAFHKSGHSRLDEVGPPQPPDLSSDYYKDRRNIGLWAEKRLKDLGMDMHSETYWNTFSEVREMMDKARDGELPEPLKD